MTLPQLSDRTSFCVVCGTQTCSAHNDTTPTTSTIFALPPDTQNRNSVLVSFILQDDDDEALAFTQKQHDAGGSRNVAAVLFGNVLLVS